MLGNKMYDVIIIGGGVVSSFVARNLAKYKLKTLVLEKGNDVGSGTTMANSALIHSGYDPLPNTNKAKFNVLGNKMIEQICLELDVPLGKIGSLTISFNEEEKEILEQLKRRSEINGVETRIIERAEIIEMEPNINKDVLRALYAPTCYICDPFNLCAHAFENALDNGVILKLNEEVIDIIKEDEYFVIKTIKETYKSKVVINCAGLYSDKIARMIEDIDWEITPKKGQYYVLDKMIKPLVKHTIFPLPSKNGKGMLITPTTGGNYLLGPSSEVTNIDDLNTDKEMLNIIKTNVLKMVPSINFNDQIRVFSGLRATSSLHDFIIEPSKKYKTFINIGGIDSPGLASACAIGEYVVEQLVKDVLPLSKNENYNPYIKKYIKVIALPVYERNALIKQNPKYGNIVCNCEKISEGEIRDLFKRSLKPTSIKSVKKRCKAGFGKCQGGFCQSKIIDIISDELNIKKTDVLYDEIGSNVLTKRLKEGKDD